MTRRSLTIMSSKDGSALVVAATDGSAMAVRFVAELADWRERRKGPSRSSVVPVVRLLEEVVRIPFGLECIGEICLIDQLMVIEHEHHKRRGCPTSRSTSAQVTKPG
jgi:hypothetical protein